LNSANQMAQDIDDAEKFGDLEQDLEDAVKYIAELEEQVNKYKDENDSLKHSDAAILRIQLAEAEDRLQIALRDAHQV